MKSNKNWKVQLKVCNISPVNIFNDRRKNLKLLVYNRIVILNSENLRKDVTVSEKYLLRIKLLVNFLWKFTAPIIGILVYYSLMMVRYEIPFKGCICIVRKVKKGQEPASDLGYCWWNSHGTALIPQAGFAREKKKRPSTPHIRKILIFCAILKHNNYCISLSFLIDILTHLYTEVLFYKVRNSMFKHYKKYAFLREIWWWLKPALEEILYL